MFQRYAVYFTASGEFAQRGAAWLGWDVGGGCPVPHPHLTEIDLTNLTKKPRKYGFHATIKPPFVLNEGRTESALKSAIKDICGSSKPVTVQGLEVAALGRFLALIPQGDVSALNTLAASVVRSLDAFRAPMPEEEMTRRGQGNLSSAQQENLRNWGYPHVMENFKFHMTLTGRIPKSEIEATQRVTAAYFAAHANVPLDVISLTLVGQGDDGCFVEIERFPLGVVSQ